MNFSILSIITDFHIILCIIFILAAWKWGDLKNYKKYYPTILFFIAVNFYYGLVTYNYPLWQFESPVIGSIISDIITNFIIFPATALIYLPYIIKTKVLKKQLLYTSFWITIYMMLEVISLHLGYFSHHNSWTIWWSLVINLMLFPLLWFHYYKPLYAWGITLVSSFFILWYFNFPINSLK